MAEFKKTITITLTPSEVAEAVARFASEKFQDDGPFDAENVSFSCCERRDGAPILENAEITTE